VRSSGVVDSHLHISHLRLLPYPTRVLRMRRSGPLPLGLPRSLRCRHLSDGSLTEEGLQAAAHGAAQAACDHVAQALDAVAARLRGWAAVEQRAREVGRVGRARWWWEGVLSTSG
jgi:hypothetical protein